VELALDSAVDRQALAVSALLVLEWLPDKTADLEWLPARERLSPARSVTERREPVRVSASGNEMFC
jgi:hypothetical protein